jgi:hypothetical protein
MLIKNMLEVSRMTKLVAAQDVDIDKSAQIKNEIFGNLRICTERISLKRSPLTSQVS